MALKPLVKPTPKRIAGTRKALGVPKPPRGTIPNLARSIPATPAPSLHELKRTPGTPQYAKRQGNIARREANQATRHVPLAAIPHLSPTLGALHSLARLDLIDTASSSDAELRRLLHHLVAHGIPKFKPPSTKKPKVGVTLPGLTGKTTAQQQRKQLRRVITGKTPPDAVPAAQLRAEIRALPPSRQLKASQHLEGRLRVTAEHQRELKNAPRSGGFGDLTSADWGRAIDFATLVGLPVGGRLLKTGVEAVGRRILTSAAGRGAARALESPAGRVIARGISPVARHRGSSGALAVNVGPGAIAASKSGHPGDILAPAKGYYQAITQNPLKVAGTSARAIEGFLAAPVGIAANVGISGGRAASTVAHAAHIPGAAGYSGKEILGPTEQQAKDIADFGAGMVKTFASGDPNKIQKAIEDQYGLTPLAMFGIPGVKYLKRAGVNDAVGAALRKTPAVKRLIELKDNRASRYAVAQHIDRHQRQAISRIAGRTGKNEVPGLGSMVESLKKTENRRKLRGNPKMTDEHLVKAIAETGITDLHGRGAEQIKQYFDTFGKRHPEVPENRIVPADVAAQLMSDPSRLKDPALIKAVDDFRARQSQSGIETSLRAKYLKQALMYGVKLPEDRFLSAGRELNVEHALAGKVDQALAEALHRSDTTGKDFTAAVEEIAKERGLSGDLMKQVDKRATEQYVADMKKLEAEKGLAEPAWTHDSNVLSRGPGAYPAPVRGYRGRTAYNRSHRSFGVLQQKGLSDQSFEALVQGSIARPEMTRAVNQSTATFLERQGKAKPVGPSGKNVRVLTAQQAEYAVRHGLIDPKSELLLSSQNTKSAILDPNVITQKPDALLGNLQDQAHQTLAEEMNRVYAMKKQRVPGSKGPTFVVVDRVKGDEFVKQHQIANTIPAKLQRGASRAILGYSPGWLLAQPVAEGAQGLAAVGGINQVRGLAAYKNLSPQEKVQFDSVFGTVPGTSGMPYPLSIHDVNPIHSRLGQAMQRNPATRIAYGVLTGHYASSIDRTKGLAIRRGVAAGHLSREYDKFTHGLGNLMGEADKLKGLSKEQVLQHFSTDPAARAKLEGYVDDTMGNWTTLTARERKLAAAVLFYPYVRMSLNWAFHTFPARHPYKAAIQHFLAQENANKVSELMQGRDPSVFQQWASAPLYTGAGGKAENLLPLWRIVPGANTITQGIGEGQNPLLSAAQATNPALGIAATSFAGVDPLTGLRYGGGQLPSVGMMARLAASQVLNLPAPLRFADAMLANGGITRAIQGKKYSEAAQLFAKAVESQRTRSTRSFLLPYLPQSVSKQALAARISGLLQDKYGSDKTKASRATGELDQLMAQYGIKPTGSSSSSDPFSHLFGSSSSSSSSSDPFSHLFK